MATQEAPYTRPNGLLKLLTCLSIMALAFVGGVVYWPQIAAVLPKPGSVIVIATPTTGGTAPRATLQPRTDPRPATGVQDSINAYNATAEAQYQQVVQPANAPVPNVDTTNDSAPLQYVSKPAPERLPAGENVPTAEPAVNDQFGSKPAAPVNIQETHTCLHGQVWTDSGCHRPKP